MSSIKISDATVVLKKGEGRTINAGGAWVFDNEINRVEGSFENGDIVEVLDHDEYFMGYGFINTNSKIRVRMMSRKKEHPVTEELIETRIRNAWDYRKAVMNPELYGYGVDVKKENDAEILKKLSCRLVFGEADYLPGITIDKFSDVLVIESLALGTDRMKELIIDTCKKVLAEDGVEIRGVYERSDAKVRE